MLILVTGGVRAGKSRLALERAKAAPPPRWCVVTADPVRSAADPEMASRIEAHRRERGVGFVTVEAPGALAAAVREATAAGASALLVDDLTLWAANRLEAADAEAFAAEADDLAAALRASADAGAVTVVVTNEVGWGIVPADAGARAYAERLARANARVARAADEVWLVVAGLPLRVR
ncbi:MAG TPA: bifunctional adenosylcobinamide kinase/adenosylcobinamide-phosphate guanylyltransferase [Thermodesulfobacteriota bacterium]